MTGHAKNATGACVDINECVNPDACAANQECSNTDGSFTCFCMVGYAVGTTDADACVDINECKSADACAVNQECSNTDGSFTCFCLDGYSADEFPPFTCGEIITAGKCSIIVW